HPRAHRREPAGGIQDQPARPLQPHRVLRPASPDGGRARASPDRACSPPARAEQAGRGASGRRRAPELAGELFAPAHLCGRVWQRTAPTRGPAQAERPVPRSRTIEDRVITATTASYGFTVSFY